MPVVGDKLKIRSSNGLSLRDGPNTRGTTLRKLGNESIVTVILPPDEDVLLESTYGWAYIETEDGIRGWIATDDGRGETYAVPYKLKPVVKPTIKRSTRVRRPKATGTESA